MNNDFAGELVQLGNYFEQNTVQRVFRYTDSVVGLRHEVTTSEIADGIRALATTGLKSTRKTDLIHDLLAARADMDVVLPDKIDNLLDVVSCYLALLTGADKDTIASFEAAIKRCYADE
jgi:ferritin-like protein